jgi:hypothetical protein
MGLLKRLYRISRFMTKRQGGVLLPATTFVVLQTRQSNVKSAGAGVALTYRAHAGLFLRWGRGRTLGFRCASAGRRREEHEQNGPDRRSGSLGRPGFLPITPVYRKLGTGQGNFIRQLMYRIAYHSAPAVRINWAMQACIMQPLPQIGARFRRRRASSRMTSRMR